MISIIDDPQIGAAKVFFENTSITNLNSKVTTVSSIIKTPILVYDSILWKKAFKYKEFGNIVVEANIVSKRSEASIKMHGDDIHENVFTKILVVNTSPNVYKTIVLKIHISDFKEVIKFNLNTPYKSALAKISKARVFYYNMDGSFISGNRFEFGEVKAKITKIKSKGSGSETKAAPEDCTSSNILGYIQWCHYTGDHKLIRCDEWQPIYGDGNYYCESSSNGSNDYITVSVDIKLDTLKADFPCVVSSVILALYNNAHYSDLIVPFQSSTRPDLTWSHQTQSFGQNGIYSLGTTQSLGLSSIIRLNTAALQNSSKLFVAAAAIHETSHAYSNYFVQQRNFDSANLPVMNWASSLINYHQLDSMHTQDPNYVDHISFMENQFNRMVEILQDFDNNQHSISEYRMAMLYGMNGAGTSQNTSHITHLNNLHSYLSLKHGLNSNVMNQFYLNNLNAEQSARVPQNCP